jgi:hypothetical protein
MRFSTPDIRARVAVLLVLVGLLCLPLPARAAEPVLYRIFLKDGSTLVSYGEFARVADRVVFSMPIGDVVTGSPDLRLVSVSDGSIDWPRTEQYAEAVRARRFAETRGEEEFAKLSAEVARTLSAVAFTKDARKRLEIANEARRMLAAWPAEHHGYRAKDVEQLGGLLDEVVADLRVAAGEPRMELSLVADTMPPPAVTLMPPPSLRETIEQAFTVARMTPESTERVSLLGAVVEVVAPIRNENWAAAIHARASSDLRLELRTEESYAELIAETMTEATKRTRLADVRGLEKLIRRVLEQDDRLGRRRPQATAALLATLDTRLADARRLRLARDAYAGRMKMLRDYEEYIGSALDDFRDSATGLEEIRALAGPRAATLGRISERAARCMRRLSQMRPPSELRTAHGLLTSAFQLAGQAAATRQKAIQTTSMDLAWQASSAAAGALMMFTRATEELERLAVPPRL